MFLHRISTSLYLVIASLLIAGTTAHAQVTPQPTQVALESLAPDHDLRSPRATVAYFLSIMEPDKGEPDLERATKALDTSEIPELIRDERAREIAVKLYTILIYKEVVPSKIPILPTGGSVEIGEINDYSIYLEQNGPNWRFSKATIRDVPDIFREIEHNLSKKELRKLGSSTAVWLTIRSYIPERLKHTTFILEDWHWVAAALTILVAMVLHFILVFFVRSFLSRAIPARLSIQPTKTIASIRAPIFIIVFTSAVQLLLSSFDLQIDFYTFAIAWISTIRILAMMLLVIRLIPLFSDRVNRLATVRTSIADEILYPLLEKAAWICVVVIGFVQILWVHGVNVSGLVAGLGLGGLAFALAAKDTIENIFGAVAILIDQPFRVGDNISMSGLTGTVEQIGLRSTRLRTPENSLVTLPNSKIIASHVDNLGARPSVRVRTVLNFSFSTPPSSLEALCVGIRELLKSHPLCVPDSIVVHFNEFAPSSLGVLVQFNLTLQAWAEEQRRKEEIFLGIIKLINELGMSLAAPTQELSIRQSVDTKTTLSPADGVEALGRLGLTWR